MASPIRMSGMVSGMDTEALVKAMVSNYTQKKEKYTKAQTKLQWKQEAFASVNSKVYSLYNKVSAFRFSSAYNMKTTKVSDSTKAMITASSKAVNGTQTLGITNTAKSGYLTGAKLKSGTTEGTRLSDLGYGGGTATISIRVGEKTKDLTVSGDTKLSELVETLNKSGVKASYDSNNLRMFVSAADTGVANDFAMTSDSVDGLMALKAAGLSIKSDANDATYLKTASYAKGLTALDGTGKIVPYYQLDGAGEIMTDSQGRYLVNPAVASGISDSEVRSATKESVRGLLDTIKNAYNAVAAAKTEQQKINGNIAFTEAKKAVYEDGLDQLTGDDETKRQLLEALKYNISNAAEEKYSYYREAYVDDEGVSHEAEIFTKYEKFYTEEGVVPLTDKIRELADRLGLVSETKTDTESADGSSAAATSEAESTANDSSDTSSGKLTLESLKASYAKLIAMGDESKYDVLDDDAKSAAQTRLKELSDSIKDNQSIIDSSDASYWGVSDWQNVDVDAVAESVTGRIMTAKSVIDGELKLDDYYNEGATRVNAEDAKIMLNGAEFTSSTNTFNINGLTIKALAVTGGNDIQINTDSDSQGLYDKVKELLGSYNEVINDLMKLYNAESAKGYEPLTEEEKDEMSDSEVEKWEKKIKDSLLRKDGTIGGVINTMTSSMMASYNINGKSYSLSSFGIHTMGFLNSAKNENYAYHIDGDSEDDVTSGNADKLLAAITNDPEGVQEFMTKLADGLYKQLGNKMQSTNLSSAYTIYNDKQMAAENTRYTRLIDTWSDKIADMEDRYYKQFANMEKQLANINSASSSIASMLGGR